LLVRDAVRDGRVVSAHDISEGGLAVALAECCLAGNVGAIVAVAGSLEELFGEAPGQGFVVSGAEADLAGIGVVIGRVGGTALAIEGHLDVELEDLRVARERGLAQWL
jgi:phosphoribosylformylglycinamidine synthase